MEQVLALLTWSHTSSSEKVAVTVCAAVIATVQVPVPEQPPPDQPSNTEPITGLAVSATVVPWS